MTKSLSGLILRVDRFEFVFDDYTLTGEWYKWRTTSPQYQRARAERIAALPGVPEGASADDAQKILAVVEKEIRAINAKVMKDTIKSWDAVEEYPATVDQATYESLSPRLQRLYKPQGEIVEGQEPDADLTYELIDPSLANGPQPVPLTVEVFEELPALFSRMLGEHFNKQREEVLNPTPPDSSQSG